MCPAQSIPNQHCETFGSYLKELLGERRRADICAQADITISQLNDWLARKSVPRSLDMIYPLADALRILN